jgi:hypothetical protein
MVDLEKLVNTVRDDLKNEYLKDQHAVWHVPFVAFIGADGPNFLYGAKSEAEIVGWLVANRNQSQIRGVVVGRMVAKYSQTIKDVEGNPQILERGILVSGRIFSPEQTYVTITPCREHMDMRAPAGDTIENAEPKDGLPALAGVNSPDKVEKIISPGGHVSFKSIQFGDEKVFDSRKGERCALDPIIEGVLATPDAPTGGLAGV